MYRIMNKGQRAFIVKRDSVLKGGENIISSPDVAINQGATVEVTDECGRFLETYSDITVIEKRLDKVKKEKVNV